MSTIMHTDQLKSFQGRSFPLHFCSLHFCHPCSVRPCHGLMNIHDLGGVHATVYLCAGGLLDDDGEITSVCALVSKSVNTIYLFWNLVIRRILRSHCY